MRSKRAQWEKRVAGWRRSGLPAAQYAESTGLNVGTLRHWSWRLKRDGVGVGGADGRRPKAAWTAPAATSLVEVVGNTSIETRFELELTCGRRVLVPSGFDAGELGRLVSLLERLEMAAAADGGSR